ncbi:hypothetical protein D9758_009795 [Tetrapyrgos nigripes]|uniref:DNA2/NAM7 helicase helicase domain-containing protein n=1 Tax=Tetrapyrgos nigripes TaxID=182062 RepID=A0A8H5GJT8_9AGAR|nr:hypothetical protein D9758_009795 [Tetrapyrgos nigripes]
MSKLALQSQDIDKDCCPRCTPPVPLNYNNAQSIINHMAAHKLYDNQLQNFKNICGLCLSTDGACRFYLRKGKGADTGFQIDWKMSQGCPVLKKLKKKFKYSTAAQSTEKSPCSDVPTKCPLCLDKTSPAPWKYDMKEHMMTAHPSANLSSYEYLWRVTNLEFQKMEVIWKNRKKTRKGRGRKREETIVVSDVHCSNTALRTTDVDVDRSDSNDDEYQSEGSDEEELGDEDELTHSQCVADIPSVDVSDSAADLAQETDVNPDLLEDAPRLEATPQAEPVEEESTGRRRRRRAIGQFFTCSGCSSPISDKEKNDSTLVVKCTRRGCESIWTGEKTFRHEIGSAQTANGQRGIERTELAVPPLKGLTTFPTPSIIEFFLDPLGGVPASIPIQRFHRRHAGNLARSLLDIASADGTRTPTIGVSISQDSEGVVSYVAFAPTEIVCIFDATPDSDCTMAPSTSASGLLPLDNLFKQLLAGKDGRSVFLAGFNMPRLALRLFVHFGYHVKGTDLSTVCSPSYTEAWLPAKVVAAKIGIGGSMDTFRINRLWHENNDSEENLCLRAWLSASEIESVKKVDTRNVRKDEMASEYDNFDLKGGDGGYELTNARYKTCVRRSKQAIVLLTDERGKEYTGRASSSKGKTTNIKFGAGQQPTQAQVIQNIRVVGQDDPTNSEKARNALLLKILQGDVNLINYMFVRLLWFPAKEDVFELDSEDEDELWVGDALRQFVVSLNASQRESPKMVIVHGPPGTGKTTTIVSAAAYWSFFGLPVWIIGHSNVSVKNIAEKLWKKKIPFRIIVSKEFYVEWHEHIYEGIASNVIRGDKMPKDPAAMEPLLQGTCV